MSLRPTYAHRSSRMLNTADLRRYQATATYRRARNRETLRLLVWALGAALIALAPFLMGV